MRTTVLLLAFAGALHADLDEAKDLFAKGRFADALAAAGAVDADEAGYAKARYLMGEIHLLLGEPGDAAAAFREALGKKPGSAPVLTGLGRALLEQDLPQEAATVLAQAVAADPKSGRALCFLGAARMRESGGDRGRKEIERAQKLAPDDPEVARGAVLAYLDAERIDDARKAARRFHRAHRKHPMGPFLEALALERDREFDDCIELYEKAIELDDAFLDAHKNLAIVCLAQNPMYRDRERTTKAFTHLERYFTLGGRDPELQKIHETLKQFFKR